MPEEPLLADLFGRMSPDHPERVAAWLEQVFGGPHAAGILERIRAGTMPCDGAWPPERIDVLARWADAGAPE